MTGRWVGLYQIPFGAVARPVAPSRYTRQLGLIIRAPGELHACNFDATWQQQQQQIFPHAIRTTLASAHFRHPRNNSIQLNVPADGHCSFIVSPYQILTFFSGPHIRRVYRSDPAGDASSVRQARLLLVSATQLFFNRELNLPSQGVAIALKFHRRSPPNSRAHSLIQYFLCPPTLVDATFNSLTQLTHSRTSSSAPVSAANTQPVATMDVALEFLDPLILDKAYAWALPHPGAGFTNSSDAAYSSLSAAGSSAPTSLWERDNIYRQIVSLLVITQIGASSLYLIFSALSYYLIFDRRLEYHPRFLENQVRQEIKSSLSAIPVINILTLPWFLAEVRGKSLLYQNVGDYGWSWLLVSSLLYMAFNDIAIYWIHRLEHHPSVYKYIHKPHHKWIGRSLPQTSCTFSTHTHTPSYLACLTYTWTPELTRCLVPTPWAALAFHPLDGYVQSLPYQ